MKKEFIQHINKLYFKIHRPGSSSSQDQLRPQTKQSRWTMATHTH